MFYPDTFIEIALTLLWHQSIFVVDVFAKVIIIFILCTTKLCLWKILYKLFELL